MFTLETYTFHVLRSDEPFQPYHGHWLTGQGFYLKNGLFIRRTLVETRRFASLWAMPSRSAQGQPPREAV